MVAAAEEGGVSLWVNGIDPGFANDWLPLVMTSVCERIDEVRCMEILNYATYDQPSVLFDIMGFGQPMDQVPILLIPGVLTTAWGSVVRQLAAGLDLTLDEIVEWHERVPAPEAFDVASGRIERARLPAMRFEIRGVVGGETKVVVEHVTRLATTSRPTGPSRPATAATGSSSPASRTTRSTSRCSAATATTTRRPQGDRHAPRQLDGRCRRGPARPAQRPRPAAGHRPGVGELSAASAMLAAPARPRHKGCSK